MQELLWLLLPIAAASGWWVARRGQAGGADVRPARTHPAYFQGLNYLLNEQPDKAIDIFIKMAEVDADTIETHMALGNLFRRRGEVDRAIRIHQNLIAKSKLEPEQRAQALLELGQDYMRAGLFDRAESLFIELTEANFFSDQSLKNLLFIYQQEKEWEKCLDVARRLEEQTGQVMQVEVAHYYCELAEIRQVQQDTLAVTALLEKAIAADPKCVRARVMQGNLALAGGRVMAALDLYRQVPVQDADYIGEVLPGIIDCYHRLGDLPGLRGYLQALYDTRHDMATMLALAETLYEQEGSREAAAFMVVHLQRFPSLIGLERLIALKEKERHGDTPNATLVLVRDLLQTLIDERPTYRCEHCGYSGLRLSWSCPGCKTWNSMKPVYGVDTEKHA